MFLALFLTIDEHVQLLSMKYEPMTEIRYVYKHDKIQQVRDITATFIPSAKSSVN